MVSLAEKLEEMNNFDWNSIVLVRSATQKGLSMFYERNQKFQRVLEQSGIEFSGLLFDLFSGIYSFSNIHANTVAIDNDFSVIKELRNQKIRAFHTDLLNHDLDDGCADMVITAAPPVNVISQKLNFFPYPESYTWHNVLLEDTAALVKNTYILLDLNSMVDFNPKNDFLERIEMNYFNKIQIKSKHKLLNFYVLKRS